MTTTHTDDIHFNRGPARRPVATTDAAVLQWSTGLTTTKREIYAGWLIETGKSDTLDDALHAAGYETVQIKHGNGNVATHWRIEVADLIILADGVQSIGEMRDTADRYGVAFWWRTLDGGRQQSQLQVQVLIRQLVEINHWEPVVLSVKSTLTGDVINALLCQFDVLDAFDAYRQQQGRPAANAPLYAFSLSIGPGAEVQRGKDQKKGIVPPVAVVSTPIPSDYFSERAIKREWVATVEALTAQAVAWSVRRSAEADGDETTPDTATEGAAYAPDAVSETPAPAQVKAAPKTAPPKDAKEAERRFYNRYGKEIAAAYGITPADVTWQHVLGMLGWPDDETQPDTVDGWYSIARAMSAASQAAA